MNIKYMPWDYTKNVKKQAKADAQWPGIFRIVGKDLVE